MSDPSTFEIIPKEPPLVSQLLENPLWKGTKEETIAFVQKLNNAPKASEDSLSPTCNTALMVNLSRGQESAAPKPLYQDSYSLYFTQAAPKFVSRITKVHQDFVKEHPSLGENQPPSYSLFCTRTAYFDSKMKDALKGGTKQFISLGCGVCTRFLRLNPGNDGDLCFVEVDDASLLRFKLECLSQQGVLYSDQYHFIGGDYTKGDICSILENVGVDPEKEVLIFWEGNVLYLKPEDAQRILSTLLKKFPKATICFDYFKHPAAMEDCKSYNDERVDDETKLFHKMVR